MRAFGYILLVLAIIGFGIVWQILRRMSAGTQAFINPERYAIHKVMELNASLPAAPTPFPEEKWNALVRYDPEIRLLAEKLLPFGEKWIRKLGQDYFALEEDRTYLPYIVERLTEEAEKQKAEEEEYGAKRKDVEKWSKFRQLRNGELCDNISFTVLGKAESHGYVLTVEPSRAIAAKLQGEAALYLESNSDIRKFGKYLSRPLIDLSKGEVSSALRRAVNGGYEFQISPDKRFVVLTGRDGWQTSLSSETEIIKFVQGMR